jgi:transcriptional regulator with XRE-family HTH domain
MTPDKVALAVAAAGGLTALAKQVTASGTPTTRHSIKRWLQTGIPKGKLYDAARKLVASLQPREAPKPRKKSETTWDDLRSLLGTWKRVAEELGISEAKLVNQRKHPATDEATLKLKYLLKEKSRAEQDFKRLNDRNIAKLRAFIKAAGNNQTRAGALLGVSEATIRRWLKNGPPVAALADMKALRPAKEPKEPQPQSPSVPEPTPEGPSGIDIEPKQPKQPRRPPQPSQQDRAAEIEAALNATADLAELEQEDRDKAFERYLALTDVPGVAKLAEHLGLTKATVKGWMKKQRVPEQYISTLRELMLVYASDVTTEDLIKLRNTARKEKHTSKGSVYQPEVIEVETGEGTIDGTKAFGYRWNQHYGEKLNHTVIIQVKAFLLDCYAQAKRKKRVHGRWQLLAFVDALKHTHDGEPVGNNHSCYRNNRRVEAGPPKKAGSHPVRVIPSLNAGRSIAGKQLPGESKSDYNKRVDMDAQRYVTSCRIGLVRENFTEALEDFLCILASTLDEGAIYLEGVFCKTYTLRSIEE